MLRRTCIAMSETPINGIKCSLFVGILMAWEYLVVELKNKGRTVYENGLMVKSHTKKTNLAKLPQSSWNEKGKAMIQDAKGSFMNRYGAQGWELVSTDFDRESDESRYVFKRQKE